MTTAAEHPKPGLLHRFHGATVRLLWRVIAPKHPRGWLAMHPVLDDRGATAWLHCHGMERWGLPNLEIRDVPVDLLGPAHGILMSVTGYVRLERKIAPDESIGGYFNGSEQAVVHNATLRRSPEPQSGHEELLCIVDGGEPATAGFPYRLFATHLITMANGYRDPARREALLRRATEIYPGTCLESPEDLEQSVTNPNNFFAWQDLGFSLSDQGREEEAMDAFLQAVARWPLGGKRTKDLFRDGIASGEVPPPDKSSISRFWLKLDLPKAVAEVQANWPAG